MEAGAERPLKQAYREKVQEIPFSGQYIAILNTKQLRIHKMLGLHKMGPIHSQTRIEKGLVGPYPPY